MKKLLKSSARAVKGYLKNRWEPIPSLLNAESYVIGTSHEGRPIEAVKVGEGPKKVLFTAMIHGNEVGTQRTLHYLHDWIQSQAAHFEDFTFWFVPCLNPDGFAHAREHPDYFKGGRKGRFNGKEVDLNRNFPVQSFKKDSHWNHGAGYKEKTPVFCGDFGGSEPETQALIDLIGSQAISVFFIFHNIGQDVMPSDDAVAQALAHTFSEHSGFAYVDRKEWEALGQTGTVREWCEENGVSFVEIEASVKATRYGSDWKRQKSAFIACLNQLKQLL